MQDNRTHLFCLSRSPYIKEYDQALLAIVCFRTHEIDTTNITLQFAQERKSRIVLFLVGRSLLLLLLFLLSSLGFVVLHFLLISLLVLRGQVIIFLEHKSNAIAVRNTVKSLTRFKQDYEWALKNEVLPFSPCRSAPSTLRKRP